MPVDRSQLPPLPGKPEWYVENAPLAVDPARAPRQTPSPHLSMPHQSDTAPTLLPSTSPLAPAAFPTAQTAPSAPTAPEQGKGLFRVKALAGRLKH